MIVKMLSTAICNIKYFAIERVDAFEDIKANTFNTETNRGKVYIKKIYI